MLTPELKEDHKASFYEWLKRDKEYERCFKPNPKAMRFKSKSSIFQSSLKRILEAAISLDLKFPFLLSFAC